MNTQSLVLLLLYGVACLGPAVAAVNMSLDNTTMEVTATPSQYFSDANNTLVINCTFTPPANTSDLIGLASMTIGRQTVVNGQPVVEELIAAVNSYSGYTFLNKRSNEHVVSTVRDLRLPSYVTLTIDNATSDQVTEYICETNIVTNQGHVVTVQGSVTVTDGTQGSVTVTNGTSTCNMADLQDVENRLHNVTQSYDCIIQTLDNLWTSPALDSIRSAYINSSFKVSNPYGGTRYYLYTQPDFLGVDFAESMCLGLGGYLAEVDDANEYNFITAFTGPYQESTNPNRVNSIYIGGRDDVNEGQWYFRYSGRPVTFFSWGPGEPNGSGHENCMVIWGVTSMGDNPCVPYPHLNTTFLCEVPSTFVPPQLGSPMCQIP